MDVSISLVGTVDGCILSTYIPNGLLEQEQALLSAPWDLHEPGDEFIESISDLAGAHLPDIGFHAAITGIVKELIQTHESAKDSTLDEQFAGVMRTQLDIARKKISNKLPQTEKNSQRIAMLPDRQYGVHSCVFNIKINHSM